MLIKLKSTRVRRSYIASGIINDYSDADDLNKPEDWLASVTDAFNPGSEKIINEGLTVCENGEILRDYIKNNPLCLGDAKDLSILVKLLDAGERLVIQCHPTDDFAQKNMNSQYGKTESWYILEANEGASVYIGFNKTATREKWIDAFNKQDVDGMLNMMHRLFVKKGDRIFVEGGVPHAIGGGCFILELQQPTDLMVVTEKVTPSGRVIPDIKIHNGLGEEKMFDCFNYKTLDERELKQRYFFHPEPKINEIVWIIDEARCEKFKMLELNVIGEYQYKSITTYSVILIAEGEGTVEDGSNKFKVKKGDRFFLEAFTDLKINSEKGIKVIGCIP